MCNSLIGYCIWAGTHLRRNVVSGGSAVRKGRWLVSEIGCCFILSNKESEVSQVRSRGSAFTAEFTPVHGSLRKLAPMSYQRSIFRLVNTVLALCSICLLVHAITSAHRIASQQHAIDVPFNSKRERKRRGSVLQAVLRLHYLLPARACTTL